MRGNLVITLFIDTSTEYLTVALIKDDKVLKVSTMSSSEHSKYAMIEIEKLFNDTDIDRRSVNKIMVTNGPGSFTGIRIGVTIAKTYAWACNINVIPISTLKAYALSYDGYNYYVPYIDARRGYVYAAIYDKDYNEVLNDSYISLEDLLNRCEELTNIAFIGKSGKDEILPNKLNILSIYNYYKEEKGITPHALVPNYLKKTEAEEKFGDIND